jgi:hypothetical protein
MWNDASSALDPQNLLRRYHFITTSSGVPVALRLFDRYRAVVATSCNVCRLNYPRTNAGLDACKRTVRVPQLMGIGLCKDHRRGTFCSLCLVSHPFDPNAPGNPCVAENEDTEGLPGADFACRHCRTDALHRAIARDPRLVSALDSPRFDPPDWEVRHVLDSFIDLGEGAVRDIGLVALEKQWLRRHTRNAEISQQAVAANRLRAREDAAAEYEPEEEDEILSDDEEDPELLAWTEESGDVRNLALHDWARTRIRDGYWHNPNDVWYRAPVIVPAVHPCPWLLSDDEAHPSEDVIRAEPFPTKPLCNQAGVAFHKAMKEVLKPAMNNIVQRMVIECAADGTDAALRAAKLSFDGIIEQLRDPGVWHRDYDWLDRRGRERTLARQQARAQRTSEEDEPPISSPTSSSHGTDTTSPVLSTSTLRTTPSPEPLKDGATSSPAVAVAMDESAALAGIPYIPQTLEHLPPLSRAPIEQAYRDACSILYNACRCSLCERAMKAHAAMQAALAPALPPMPVPPPVVAPVREEEEDGAEEVLYSDVEDPDVAIIDVAGEDEPALEPSRKRQLDADDDAPPAVRADTPPKRAKVRAASEAPEPAPQPAQVGLPSAHMPVRLLKRGDASAPDAPADEPAGTQHKRQRTASEPEEGGLPPQTLYPPALP